MAVGGDCRQVVFLQWAAFLPELSGSNSELSGEGLGPPFRPPPYWLEQIMLTGR